jgi:hypothetical protein
MHEEKYYAGKSRPPQNVLSLWNAILEYARCEGDVAGEGNSGEFSNEATYLAAEKALDVATKDLFAKFGVVTGWVPKYVTVEEGERMIYIKQGKKRRYGDWIHGFFVLDKIF